MSLLKRVSLIIALLAVSGLIGYGLYFLFTRTAEIGRPAPPLAPALQPGQLPPAGLRPATTTGITQAPPAGELLPIAGIIEPSAPSYYKPTPVSKIVSETATHPSLNTGGDLRFYNANDG